MTSLLIRFPNTDVFDLAVSGSKLRLVSKRTKKGNFTSMKRFLNRVGNGGKRKNEKKR